MNYDFLTDRINHIKDAIISAENAELDLINGSISSYSINTGQSSQSVTKQNITELRKYISALYLRLDDLTKRRDGASLTVGVLRW